MADERGKQRRRGRGAALLAQITTLIPAPLRRSRRASLSSHRESTESVLIGTEDASVMDIVPGNEKKLQQSGWMAGAWPWSRKSSISMPSESAGIASHPNAASANAQMPHGVLKTAPRSPSISANAPVVSDEELHRRLAENLRREQTISQTDDIFDGYAGTSVRRSGALSPPPPLRSGHIARPHSPRSAPSPRGRLTRSPSQRTQASSTRQRSSSGRRISFPRFACLLDAASEGDVAEVRALLQAPPSPGSIASASLELGDSPPIDAVVRTARRRIADQTNATGVTALHCATGCGHAEVVRVLLEEAGAAVNVADDDGWTPLHSAAHNGDVPMVVLLLSAGADAEACDADGRRAIDVARSPDTAMLIEEVLAAKATAVVVRALYDFDRADVRDSDGSEMESFKRGEILEIIERPEDAWWLARRRDASTGRTTVGLVPRAFVQ